MISVAIILLEEKFLKGNPQFVNQEISNFKKYFVCSVLFSCILFIILENNTWIFDTQLKKQLIANRISSTLINNGIVFLTAGDEDFLFLFILTGCSNEAKRGVGFHHSTRNASRVRQKEGNGSVLMRSECPNTRFPGSLCLSYFVYS